MKKRILAALIASAAVLSLAGCKTNESNNSGSNSDGNVNNSSNAGNDTSDDGSGSSGSADDTLSILTWNGNSDTTTMVQYFLQQKGYDSSKVTIVGVGDDGEGARDGYKQYLMGDGDADLMIFDCDWVADYTTMTL